MFPKYKEIQEPLLNELFRRGGKAQPSDPDEYGLSIYDVLAIQFQLNKDELNEEIFEANGKPRSKWKNMVRWARNDLFKKGLINNKKRGTWEISENGYKFLEITQKETGALNINTSDRSITPDKFKESQEKADYIGEVGEKIVLEHEIDFLNRNNRQDLAKNVKQISKSNIAAGYDILSYTIEGAEKFIEVKSTSLDLDKFEITINEWNKARALGDKYWVYRVKQALSASPKIEKINNPFLLFEDKKIILLPVAFQVIRSEDFD